MRGLDTHRTTTVTLAAHARRGLIKVQNPRHKMQVALLAEPKTPLESACLLTLGAHARGLLVCLSVCLSVYPSVPALAASASVETSKQRYSRGSLRLFLD